MLGLSSGLYDVGLTLADDGDAGFIATPLWEDPLMVVLPTRHPLLAYKELPLKEVVSYPLVLCDHKDSWAAPGPPDTLDGNMCSGGSDGNEKEVHGRVQA